MPAKSLPINQITVQYEGLFDFDGLYSAIIDWAKNYGYMWHEQDYKHKVPNPLGAEQQFKWHMHKRIDKYVVYKFKIKAHIWEMLDVEVDVGGKKKVLTKARVYIKIDGNVDLDWQNRFKSTNRLSNWMHTMYQKVYVHELGGEYWDTLNYRAMNLHHVMKQFFDMQNKKYAYKGYVGES